MMKHADSRNSNEEQELTFERRSTVHADTPFLIQARRHVALPMPIRTGAFCEWDVGRDTSLSANASKLRDKPNDILSCPTGPNGGERCPRTVCLSNRLRERGGAKGAPLPATNRHALLPCKKCTSLFVM